MRAWFMIGLTVMMVFVVLGCSESQPKKPMDAKTKALIDAHDGAYTWLECEEGFLREHRIWDEDFNYLHTADLVLNDAGIPTRCGDARINVKESVATGSLSGGV